MAGRTRPVSPCLLCHESPEDETYPQLDVNYVRLDRPPKFSEGWPPVLDALRAGTSSSLQARCYCAIIQFRGPAPKSTFVADVDWTLPAEFMWGDGKTTRPRSCPGDSPCAVLNASIQHPVRCNKQKVGTFCGRGFGGQRSVHPVGASRLMAGKFRNLGLFISYRSCLRMVPVADLNYYDVTSQSSRFRPFGCYVVNGCPCLCCFPPRARKRYEEGRKEERVAKREKRAAAAATR